MGQIILFNAKDEEKEILQVISSQNNIDIIEISMEDLDQKVGFLAGLDGFEEIDKKSDYESIYDFTFMLFKDFDNKEIFSFIDLMKEKNLYIPHKAALTESNVKWPLRFLLDENDEEHRTMILINEINSLVKVAHEHKKENGENLEIKNLVNTINKYFSDPENFDLERAKEYKKQLEILVNKL